MAENIDDTFLINRFPYTSRLASNDVPSDDEMEEIKKFLREPTEQLQQMEVEIASLQAKVDLLRRRHAAMKKQIEKCRSIITIPRRLPDDILLEIFIRCLPEMNSPPLDRTSAPLLLIAICRRWRLLSLQTPNLWAAIELNMKHIHHWIHNAGIRDTTKFIDYILSKWLERSGTCPLTISLPGVDSSDKIVRDCSDILFPFASRWKDVFLSGNFHSLSTLFSIPSSEFQSLESIFLHFSNDKFPTDIPNTMLNAPRLRKVSIQSKALNPQTLTLPWARLTHLDLSTPPSTIFWHAPELSALSAMLNKCTSLIYLGLDVDSGRNLNVNPMYLPQLQRLIIRQPISVAPHRLTASSLFAENLKAPSLRHISLRNFTREGFLAVLSNHGQSLQTLDLNIEYDIMIDAFNGLRHCPRLESLSILRLNVRRECFFRVDEKFFSIFTGGDENNTDPLCPLLQEIVLDCKWCPTLSGLVSFLEKKQSADPRSLSPLIKLSIDYLRENGKSLSKATVIDALKPFINQGLRFEMWGKDRPYYFGGTEDWNYRHSSRFQYADCWRDC